MSRRRTKARELALQMLYQNDVNPDVDSQTVHTMIREQLADEPSADFAWELFVGVMEWRSVLDNKIESVAENWRLERMAPTDRNVIRLGTFELLYRDTPHRVVIDEAIELAKRFGTAQSPQFVNGILDRLVPDEKRAEDRASQSDREE